MVTVADLTISRNGHLTHTEAPVSMNAFVDVDGVGRVQVTARGSSGLEAATNLKHSVGALVGTFAPAPEPTREERLAKLLTCVVVKATAKGDFALIERLTKAYAIAVKGMVEHAERLGVWAVRSMQDSDTWYAVEPLNGALECSCPDWTNKTKKGEAGYRCKHVLSVLMVERLDTQEAGR